MTNVQIEMMRLDTSTMPRSKREKLKPRRLRRQEMRDAVRAAKLNQKKID